MSSGHLRVIVPGLMTTVQDLGRPGYQRLGVPPSGALDPVALRAANLLVGNPTTTASLEMARAGATFAVEVDSVRIALAGAVAEIDTPAGDTYLRLNPLESARLRSGQRLRIALSGSAVAYLAVEGGFVLPEVMGSLSTLTRAAIGGFAGRALRAGDLLPLCHRAAAERPELALPMLPLLQAPPPQHAAKIRIVLGPQDDHFSAAGLQTLLSATYTITQASDRMGMRLAGPALEHAQGYDIVSDGIATGAIQVPGDGLPIALLADRQTTGGYPKIATVISADIPALGRLSPSAEVAFTAVTVAAAEAAARRLSRDIAAMLGHPVARGTPVLDAARLMGENLVSGMVDAREGGEN
jgi:biotin-dependent carboxylase-like uncharacterized protein